MQRKVLGLTYLVMISLFFPLVIVSGDVPNVLEINATVGKDETMLIVEVRHSSPSSSHFVDSIEIRLDDGVEKVFSQEPQSSTRFTIELKLDESVEKIDVRVHCTAHGWSKWATFTEGPVEQEPSGIPGFPYISVILGLFISFLFSGFYTRDSSKRARIARVPWMRTRARAIVYHFCISRAQVGFYVVKYS